MGAGKKPQMLLLGGGDNKNQHFSSSVNNNYRNLRRNDLGGVIFGCTNTTIKECLSNQIFGLPSQHFIYIKNVEPGLPLFLFNYSDRKLHGIFEAASQGQMNINPYGWSGDGTERTQYPAQVRICIRMKCQPLPEKKFGTMISDNYFLANHFWFELDHAQASGLITLFESSPTMGSTSTVSRVPKDAPIWKPLLKSTLNHDKRHETEDSLASVSKVDTTPSAFLTMESGFPHDAFKLKSVLNMNPDHTARNEEGSKTVEFAGLDQSNICANKANQMSESYTEKEVEKNEELIILNKLKQFALETGCSKTYPNRNGEGVDVPHEKNDTPLEDNCSIEAPLISTDKCEEISINPSNLQSLVNQLRQEIGELKNLSTEQLQKTTSLERTLIESEFQVRQLQGQVHQLKGRVKQLESQLSTPIRCVDEPLNNLNASNQTSRDPFDELRFGVNELVFMLGGFDGTSWLSALDCYSPSRDIMKSLKTMSCARSYAASSTLNGDIYIFGGGDGTSWYNTVESYNPLRNEWISRPPLLEKKGSLAGATLHNKIYAIGGGNGIDCFSDVEMFDPSIGRWITAQSMLQKRFSPAAAELNGVIYAVGGFDGNNYLKSAERFDPREVSWSRLQDMNTSRGCPSVVVLNEKLYALGGFDGVKMVPSVEVFDPRIGTWMSIDEMKEARGYSVSAVIGEAIYAFGGVRQGNVLDTVECYKGGQGWQLTNLKEVGKRGFFTAVVL